MSFPQYLQGRAIQTGCEWRLSIRVNSPVAELYPTNAKFTAHVRRDVEGPVLATLSSDTNTIRRINGNSLELVIPASASRDWPAGKVFLDVLRTDPAQPVHLGFQLEIPVKRSITRL